MIKYLAISAMIVDHVGLLFLPDHVALRIVGRLAMPLFCCLVALGSTRTTRPAVYAGLLFGFALISQPVAIFVFDRAWWSPNVLYTLGLGLLATRSPWLILPAVVVAIPAEYGPSAVVLIVAMHWWLRSNEPLAFVSAVLATVCLNTGAVFDVAACLALLLFVVLRSNVGQRLDCLFPRGPRLLFYVFYPAHIAVLGVCAALVA